MKKRQYINVTLCIMVVFMGFIHLNSYAASCAVRSAYYPYQVVTTGCSIIENNESLVINRQGAPTLTFSKSGDQLVSEHQIPTDRKAFKGGFQLANSSGIIEVDRASDFKGFKYEASHPGHQFLVSSANDSSINTARLIVSNKDTKLFDTLIELDGVLTGAEVADLDSNGYPEIYIYATSAGSGSYASVNGYASNSGKSFSEVYMPPLAADDPLNEGFMGHDQYRVVENRLVRRYPLYNDADTNAAPTGKTRQLQYRLEAGEAGWILRLDRSIDY